MTTTAFQRAVAALPLDPPVPEAVTKTLELLYAILQRDDTWSGGCYLVTAIGHILLAAQGIESIPCLGDVVSERGPWDHGWLEIGGAVYDLPIQYPLDPGLKIPVVVGGLHLDGTKPRVLYGTDPRSYGPLLTSSPGSIREHIERQSLIQYLDGAVEHRRDDVWSILLLLGRARRLDLDRETLRKKHATTRWVTRDSVPVPAGTTDGWLRISQLA